MIERRKPGQLWMIPSSATRDEDMQNTTYLLLRQEHQHQEITWTVLHRGKTQVWFEGHMIKDVLINEKEAYP